MEFMSNCLDDLQEKGLQRKIRYLDKPQSSFTVIDGKRILLLASNSYLGLCDDQRLKEAAIEAANNYGVGSGGSRLTTGSYKLHQELEEKLASFKGTGSALLFNTGYMANLGAIAAIADKEWTIFSDELNHASIIDGCKLSGAKVVIYKHCDMDDLLDKVKNYKGQKRLIISDGVFSMDGDIAPLPEIVNIARDNNILTMVDDAHGTGVLGKNGAGTVEYFNLKGKIDIQIGTLSKAFASEGGYIAGSKILIEYLRHRARSFIYSTALSPITIGIALKALEIIISEPNLRKNLLSNSKWLQERLLKLGFKVLESKTPIIPIIIGDAKMAVEISESLFKAGIYIPAIRPPTVPVNTSRLRITLMATHTIDDLQLALVELEQVIRGRGLV